MSFTSLLNYNPQTTNYNLSASDDVVSFNCSSGSLTATLPSASLVVVGKRFEIRRAADATIANTLTINTTSAQTVDGRASGNIKLQPSDYIVVVSDGSNWQVVNMQETVTARYSGMTSNTIASGSINILDFNTKVYDTHGAVTTGSSWRFNPPCPGYYTVKVSTLMDITYGASTEAHLELFKTGSIYSRLFYKNSLVSQSLEGFSFNGGDDVYLGASDYLDVRFNNVNTGNNASTDVGTGFFQIVIKKSK